MSPQAIRVKTASGWQDIALQGPPGPPATVPLVSSLPASPTDGQEIYYRVDANTLWHLRYDAAVADAYKWLFLGGASRYAEQSAASDTPNSTPGDGTGPVVQVVAPLRGYYVLSGGILTAYTGNTNNEMRVGYKIGSAAVVDWGYAREKNGAGAPYTSIALAPRQILVATAGDAIKQQYWVGAVGGTAVFHGPRTMRLDPVRVG